MVNFKIRFYLLIIGFISDYYKTNKVEKSGNYLFNYFKELNTLKAYLLKQLENGESDESI